MMIMTICVAGTWVGYFLPDAALLAARKAKAAVAR